MTKLSAILTFILSALVLTAANAATDEGHDVSLGEIHDHAVVADVNEADAEVLNSSSCRDERNFRFVSRAGRTVSCSFLRLPAHRRNNCDRRGDNDRLVRFACRRSCNNCRSSEPTCRDRRNWRFTNQAGRRVGCSFITLPAHRRNNCDRRGDGGTRVRIACRRACQNCRNTVAEE